PPPGAKAPPGAAAPKPAAPKPAPTAAPVVAAAAPAAVAAKPAAPRPAPAKVEAAPAVAAAPAAPKSVSRREFLNYVWGASMALFLAQFGGISFLFAMPRFREGEVGGRFSQSVADFGYDANGLPNANNVGKFWMVKVGDTINAIYKVCTHLGCLYGWNSTGKIFACPCHGSQFEVDGKWIAGPAPRNLDRFKMQILDTSGNVIASSDEAGSMIKLPAGADRIIVDTGAKISGKAHF
ncbi:MAG: ubiquinol-cytochrome c reductase iron-sulfur subunit, partial [Thermoflexales bacterium]|nr:ubiquinol-cytochrome c reductase iron-sulfur subunit [Thermoflexales bacterium]